MSLLACTWIIWISGSPHEPNCLPIKMILGIVSYFATLIFAAYSAVLISILLDSDLDLPFWNYYSLLHQSDYKVGCESGVVFESYFQVRTTILWLWLVHSWICFLEWKWFTKSYIQREMEIIFIRHRNGKFCKKQSLHQLYSSFWLHEHEIWRNLSIFCNQEFSYSKWHVGILFAKRITIYPIVELPVKMTWFFRKC